MKNKLKYFIIGFLICLVLTTTTPVLANAILQKIDVILNTVKVEINGEKLDSNSILYNGTTYLPMRTVAEAVGKDVTWNQDTMTANIIDTTTNIMIESVKEGGTLEEFVITEIDGIEYGNKNGEEFYSASYVIRMINEYDFYGIDFEAFAKGNLRFYDKNNYILKENVPYEYVNDRIFISKTYYENTILPLINK